MLLQMLNNPQILADDAKIIGLAEYHPPEIFRDDSGALHIKHFSLSEGYNTQGWRVRDIERFIRSGLNKPTIITPGFHHIVGLDRDKLLKDMEPFTIGYAVDFVKNPKYNCYDAITKITDPDAEKAIDAGYIPPFMSPLVHASKWHIENIEGIDTKIFDEWELMQHAVVIKPGFRPVEMARIREFGCKGTTGICASKLAGIASDISKGELLKNYFDAYISQPEKNNIMGENDKPNPMESLLKKLQDDLLAKEKEKEILKEKYQALEIKAKADSEALVTITAERDNVKKEVTDYKKKEEIEGKKKSFDDKLKKTKMFFQDADARAKKVEELVNKNIAVEDLDSIYEGMYYTDEQLKELMATPTGNSPTPVSGIASDITTGMQTSNSNTKHAEGAKILSEILGL